MRGYGGGHIAAPCGCDYKPTCSYIILIEQTNKRVRAISNKMTATEDEQCLMVLVEDFPPDYLNIGSAETGYNPESSVRGKSEVDSAYGIDELLVDGGLQLRTGLPNLKFGMRYVGFGGR